MLTSVVLENDRSTGDKFRIPLASACCVTVSFENIFSTGSSVRSQNGSSEKLVNLSSMTLLNATNRNTITQMLVVYSFKYLWFLICVVLVNSFVQCYAL